MNLSFKDEWREFKNNIKGFNLLGKLIVVPVLLAYITFIFFVEFIVMICEFLFCKKETGK